MSDSARPRIGASEGQGIEKQDIKKKGPALLPGLRLNERFGLS